MEFLHCVVMLDHRVAYTAYLQMAIGRVGPKAARAVSTNIYEPLHVLNRAPQLVHPLFFLSVTPLYLSIDVGLRDRG